MNLVNNCRNRSDDRGQHGPHRQTRRSAQCFWRSPSLAKAILWAIVSVWLWRPDRLGEGCRHNSRPESRVGISRPPYQTPATWVLVKRGVLLATPFAAPQATDKILFDEAMLP